MVGVGGSNPLAPTNSLLRSQITTPVNIGSISDDVKVQDFGDVWKVTLEDGVAKFLFRENFQPVELQLDNIAL